jgi:PTH1 family peptidyl-tRNA hydrolase
LLDALAAAYGGDSPAWQKKNNYLWQKITISTQSIFLIKPQNFMNRSGEAVASFASFYKFSPASFLVIHDDLDLAPGKLRMKQGGGDGGHNGLKSIDSHLGKDYWRLRVGIGRPANKEHDISDYVLGRFTQEEQEVLADYLAAVLEEFPTLLRNGAEHFMSAFAARLQSQTEKI